MPRLNFDKRLRELAALRDAIKRDFLKELDASAGLQVGGEKRGGDPAEGVRDLWVSGPRA